MEWGFWYVNGSSMLSFDRCVSSWWHINNIR